MEEEWVDREKLIDVKKKWWEDRLIICGDGLSMRVERVKDDFKVFNLGWIVNYYKEYCKKWLRYEKKKIVIWFWDF